MDALTVLAAVAVVLFALVVGLAIPVLLQARATLRSAQQFLDSTSTKVNLTLAELARLTTRLNRVVDEVEGNLPRVRRVLEATDGVAESLAHLRGSLKVMTAVGPAAFAAVKAIFSSLAGQRPAAPEPETAAIAAAESEGMTPRAVAS